MDVWDRLRAIDHLASRPDADAEKRDRSSWFESDHLVEFTFNNIAPWLKENFKVGV
jgi:hypothetical protein